MRGQGSGFYYKGIHLHHDRVSKRRSFHIGKLHFVKKVEPYKRTEAGSCMAARFACQSKPIFPEQSSKLEEISGKKQRESILIFGKCQSEGAVGEKKVEKT